MDYSTLVNQILAHKIQSPSLASDFDIHLTNLGGENRNYDRSLWISLNLQFEITNWKADFGPILEEQRPNDFDIIVLSTMQILSKAGLTYLFGITLREVENFSRDDNSQSQIKDLFRYQSFFDAFIKRLIGDCYKSLLLKSGMKMHLWETLNFRQKHSVVSEMLSHINKVFGSKLATELTLVAIQENKIIIDFCTFELKQRGVIDFLEALTHYFQLSLCNSDINLVAQ